MRAFAAQPFQRDNAGEVVRLDREPVDEGIVCSVLYRRIYP